jgi:hypothetical protein
MSVKMTSLNVSASFPKSTLEAFDRDVEVSIYVLCVSMLPIHFPSSRFSGLPHMPKDVVDAHADLLDVKFLLLHHRLQLTSNQMKIAK